MEINFFYEDSFLKNVLPIYNDGHNVLILMIFIDIVSILINFFLTQVKRGEIFSNGIYELPHKLPNGLGS